MDTNTKNLNGEVAGKESSSEEMSEQAKKSLRKKNPGQKMKSSWKSKPNRKLMM